jgi:hypothetical protein
MLLQAELESVGIRLNKRKPNIYFKVNLIQAFCTRWETRTSVINNLFNANNLGWNFMLLDKEDWWYFFHCNLSTDLR